LRNYDCIVTEIMTRHGLGDFEQAVLLAIAHLGGEAYGIPIETLSFLMRYSIERVMRGIRGGAGGNAAPSTLDLKLCGSADRQVVVGLIAAAAPARRGLRVQPTEALRGE
jgi:hypothetical protein